MTPRSPRPGFGAWQPAPEPPPRPRLDRAGFRGLAPAEAARRLVQAVRDAGLGHREITLRNKASALRRVLEALWDRGKDLATVQPGDVRLYHAYLKDMAGRGLLSEDTCSNLARNWNSTVRLVFGLQDRPGKGLIMKGFQQHPAKRARLTQPEFDAMIGALDRHAFRWMHTRLAFQTYLEVAWCSGARIGSLLGGRLVVGDVDPTNGTIILRHMKNNRFLPEGEHHVIVLTPRATMAVKRWIRFLEPLPLYSGANTVLFVGPQGKPLTVKWVNETLRELAKAAGINKRISTHTFRRSAGTLIGSKNPKLAQEQLGISDRVFRRHYFVPLLEDRLAARGILPGATGEEGDIGPTGPWPPKKPRAPWEPESYQ